MKKILIFTVICFVTLSIGLTSYFILNDRESIYVLDVRVNANSEELFEIEVEHLYPRRSTVIEFNSRQPDVVFWNSVTNQMQATDRGGRAIVEVLARGRIIDTVIVSVGNGTGQFPFYIRNEEELASIGVEQEEEETTIFGVDDHYILVNSLDMTRLNGGDYWNPIGYGESEQFSGTFNFNNKTISNLNLDRTETDSNHAGLFYSLAPGARVTRLTMDNVSIEGEFDFAGVIAGVNNGRIELIEIKNSYIRVSGSNSVFGMVAGVNATVSESSRAFIDKVAIDNTNVIENPVHIAGGITGINTGGTILNSFSRVEFALSDVYLPLVGGISAINEYSEISAEIMRRANIRDVYFAGDFDYVGDIPASVGVIFNENIDHSNGMNRVVGIYYPDWYPGIEPVVVLDNGNLPQSLDGNIEAISLSDFYDTRPYLSFTDYRGNDIKWNFSSVWTVDPGELPLLNMDTSPVNGMFHLMSTPGEIMNLEQLKQMNIQPGDDEEHYTIAANIDLSGISSWTPIGTKAMPFTGRISRSSEDDYVISGLTINKDNLYNGLFGVVGQGAHITGLIFEDVDISGGANVGALAGKVEEGATIEDIKVNSGTIVSSMTSDREYTEEGQPGSKTVSELNIGGAIGKVSGSNIDNIRANVSVEGDTRSDYELNIGGAFGVVENTDISNIYSSSTILVSGRYTSFSGGILGTARFNNIEFEISNVMFDGQFLTSTNRYSGYAGGIVGKMESGTKLSIAKVTQSAVIKSYRAGGIVGLSSGMIDQVHMQGTVEGHRIGGIAYRIVQGVVSNALADGNLENVNSDSISSGFAHYIEFRNADDAGWIINSFTRMAFTEERGENYAETSAPIRTQYWEGARSAGFIDESVVFYNAQDLISQKFRAGFFNSGALLDLFNIEPEKSINEEEADGRDGNFGVFYERGIESTTWTFNVGFMPTLTNVDELNFD